MCNRTRQDAPSWQFFGKGAGPACRSIPHTTQPIGVPIPPRILPQLKRWVERGKEDEARKEMQAVAAPPPKVDSASSMAAGSGSEAAASGVPNGKPLADK